MNNKRILFFSCEPGGAEVLIPVIELLKKRQPYDIVVLGYGYALRPFAEKNISFFEVPPIKKDDFELFERFAPNFIITSATSLSSGDMSERFMWHNAKQAGIQSFAFLDQWSNYRSRFLGDSEGGRSWYLPDYINCVDEIAKNEMLEEGFNPDILLCLGHPHLSCLKRDIEDLSGASIKSKIGVPCDKGVVTFFSAPIHEYYGVSRGYDQFDAIEVFLQYLSKEECNKTVILKLHPKEDTEKYKYLSREYKKINIKIISNEITALDCLKISDEIYGMDSIMLIKAFILGKLVVSIQPNLKGKNDLVLSRLNYIKTIKNGDGFYLKDNMHRQDVKPLDFEFKEDVFLQFIKKCLNK